ncbi:hypothetical protein [Pseudonocardia sp. ICBG1142]|uniref:hypothetical protein n=1 Tax=Pseudonocardia sp. ICBG1142 TaxID=2846760 RepID=UPI001CF62CE6|nr:hypothetical protein [Pseudonocardia sp. ICBG1142]
MTEQHRAFREDGPSVGVDLDYAARFVPQVKQDRVVVAGNTVPQLDRLGPLGVAAQHQQDVAAVVAFGELAGAVVEVGAQFGDERAAPLGQSAGDTGSVPRDQVVLPGRRPDRLVLLQRHLQ